MKWFLWGIVGAYLIAIWWLSSRGSEVTARVDAAGVSDFSAHLALFGGLSFLLRLALQVTWPDRSCYLLGLVTIIATFAYGLVDEWHQSYVPGRGFDAQDLWGDLAGAVAGQFVAGLAALAWHGVSMRY